MLLSKWIVADMQDYLALKKLPIRTGFCLNFQYAATQIADLYKFVQEIDNTGAFTILFSDKSIPASNIDDALDAITTLFFKPAFYIIDYSPVIFTEEIKDDRMFDFLKQLKKKCIAQGFSDLIVLCPAGAADTDLNFNYYNFKNETKLLQIIDNWTTNCLKENDYRPVHILINKNDLYNNLLYPEFLQEQVSELIHTKDYMLANKLYNLKAEQHNAEQKLQLQKINEDNLQTYLEIQKKDLAKALSWYHYEYDILPLWYKRLGHIIKVLMGKRSFRSLFSDKFKKYKD